MKRAEVGTPEITQNERMTHNSNDKWLLGDKKLPALLQLVNMLKLKRPEHTLKQIDTVTRRQTTRAAEAAM